MQYEIEVGGRVRQVHVHRAGGQFVVNLDDRQWLVDAARIDHHSLSLLIEPHGITGTAGAPLSHEVTIAADPVSGQFSVGVDGVRIAATLNGRRRWGRRDESATGGSGPQRITAPMPGKIVRLLIKPGDLVQPRQGLVVVEAMKMENELRATRDGTVTEVLVHEGQLVDAGMLLAVIRPA